MVTERLGLGPTVLLPIVVLSLHFRLLAGEEGSTAVVAIVPRDLGEPCSCDSDCDFSKWLNCQDGLCSCLSTTFQYDYDRKSCVVKIGEKCFELGADYSQYKDLPPTLRCVDGAFCSMSAGGTCACNTYGFYSSSDGSRCQLKKAFGRKCSHSLECKSDLCSPTERKCVCMDGQYYDRTMDKCLGLVNAFCFTDDECTPNAICNGRQGARCICAKGFSPTEGHHCMQQDKFGDPCNATTDPCNSPSLSCLSNNTCGCKYPNHQILDLTTGYCRALAFTAPCGDDAGCVSSSVCHFEPGGYSECRCPPGHVEMEDGHCAKFKSHGVACTSSDECDPLTPLVCKDQICQCEDSLSLFDPKRRTCRGLHGFRGCKDDAHCSDFATCVQFNSKLPSKCVCQGPRYKPASDRTCVPH